MKYYSYSYKYKAKFYNTLNIDINMRKLIRKYNEAKDQVLNNKEIYFIKKESNEIQN